MNSSVHTHILEYGRGRFGGFYTYKVRYTKPENATKIQYGDTRKWWPHYIPLFLDSRREHKVKQIILKHNKGSVSAGIKQDTSNKLVSKFNEIANEHAKVSGWS